MRRESKLREKEESVEKYKKYVQQLRGDAKKVFDTDEGLRVLRYIYGLSNQDRSTASFNAESGELLVNSMIFDEASRTYYLRIRQILPPELVKRVELEGLQQEEIS